MASSNTAVCADPMNCPVQLTSLSAYSPHIPRDTMLRGAAHVIQRPKLLEVSLRGKENVAKTTREFESSASPVAWHVCSWCNILQVTWCPCLKQTLHKILLHKLHKNLSFTWTQLCLHVIHAFRRTCENISQSFMVCVD